MHGILIIDNGVGVPLVGIQNNGQSSSGQPHVGVSLVDTQMAGIQNNVQPPSSGQPQGIAPTGKKSIGGIIGAFKSLTTNEYIRGVKNGKFPPFEKRIWQRNYYEHIIRNEQSLEKIQNYIIHNPQKWQDDKFFVHQ